MSERLRVELADWLLGDEASALPPAGVLAGLCQRLVAGGVPVWRGHVGSRTMHPEVFVRFYDWYEGDERAREQTLPHSVAHTDTVTKSPVSHLLASGGEPLRIPLEVPPEEIRFPMLLELRAQGATDYLCLALESGAGQSNMVSFTTRRPGGFDDDDLAVLQGIVPPLRMRTALDAERHALASLLRTYLGQNAAHRVLGGSFRRGSGEVIDAAIWMSDLRDFTKRVDTSALPDVLEALNTYFSCIGDAVVEHGGEILKFIGDAVLAVFPLEGDARAACRRALTAAEVAMRRMDEANLARERAGRDRLAFGVVLHRGEVMYGNIGASERLDFTVIGKAVNEASRVESLCKQLGTPLLFTEAFASVADDERAVSLGRHELRGVASAPEIFTHADLRR